MQDSNQIVAYGAPELKKGYLKNLARGLEIAVILHVVSLAGYLILYSTGLLTAGEHLEKKPLTILIDIRDIEPPPINEQEIPREQEQVVKPVKSLESLEPLPVAKNIAEAQTTKTQQQLDSVMGTIGREGDSLIASNDKGTNQVDIKTIDKNIDNNRNNDTPPDEIAPIWKLEVKPECVNLDNVRASTNYPKIAVEAGIEGQVFVKVLVGTDGKVIETGKITGNEVFHDVVREKAKELIFTPGLQNNKPVKVWVSVPFNFRLK
jgi:protein TonB